MDKIEVYKAIQKALLSRFENAKWAAQQAHDAATNEESVAENKYDTFGLEASYLAHGQSQRVVECEKDWVSFQNIDTSIDYDAVGLWCLVKLVSYDDVTPIVKCFFISPCAGGLTIEVNEQAIYLVTASSPVGQLLIGKSVEDEVDLSQSGKQVTYEIELVL